jgi:hypothetical protein
MNLLFFGETRSFMSNVPLNIYYYLKGSSNLPINTKLNNFTCKYVILFLGGKVLNVQFDGGVNASLCFCIWVIDNSKHQPHESCIGFVLSYHVKPLLGPLVTNLAFWNSWIDTKTLWKDIFDTCLHFGPWLLRWSCPFWHKPNLSKHSQILCVDMANFASIVIFMQ